MNQNIGDRTRSKVNAACNLDFQGDFFRLYYAVNFQNKINISNKKEIDLQLGGTECNVYQTALERNQECH
jgi:hypothetical protein